MIPLIVRVVDVASGNPVAAARVHLELLAFAAPMGAGGKTGSLKLTRSSASDAITVADGSVSQTLDPNLLLANLDYQVTATVGNGQSAIFNLQSRTSP